MIISRTPFRISFFGGGTDYEPWYSEHGGAVLSTTINRYCYINCRFLPQFFDYRNRIVWSKIETCNEYNEISHPVVREVLRLYKINGVEIHHDGDLPSRAGLGSSSAFTVGLLHALNSLNGNMSSKRELVNSAIYVEKDLLKENVGVQDQIAVAYGGINKIQIEPNGNFQVHPLTISTGRKLQLESSLLLFYTGISRLSSEIAGDNIRQIPNNQAQLRLMRKMVDDAVNILYSNSDINQFGELLNESWMLKRKLSSLISTTHIDEIYSKAKESGAIGGKVLGAGGGGFMLFFVPLDRRQDVINSLKHLLMVPIKFESSGSQIIFFEPNAVLSK
jgi:D-glycero-alpha-D-manno-heptose-7-phosphate kinase